MVSSAAQLVVLHLALVVEVELVVPGLASVL
jgi:hypothetical protein